MANNQRAQCQYVVTGNPETVNSKTAFALGQLGRYVTVKIPVGSTPVDMQDEAGRDKEYRYIKTDSVMTVPPSRGLLAYWKDKSRYTVTTDQTARGRGFVAGVFKGPISPGNYGFIQTAGPSIVQFDNGTTETPVGTFIIPGTGTGTAAVIAAGSAATYPTIGLSLSVQDASNPFAITGMVELNIPDLP